MLVCDVHAFLPHLRIWFDTAQLSDQNIVETIEVVFSPYYTGTCHRIWKALLVYSDCVLDHRKVDKRNLEYIKGEVAFEDTLPTDKLVLVKSFE